MKPRAVEVGDIFRAHGDAYRDAFGASMSEAQKRVLRNLSACRTAALGGHVLECDACGHREISYNSCRDRHCPKCQATARAEWMEARAKDLLPTEYFHVVFTLPDRLEPLALQNKKVVYGLLFDAAWRSLAEIAADPKHLGARIGCVAVLHTWGQNLLHHPHLHCVVPGGGLSSDRSRWIPCRPGFFLPVRVLSRLFRGKLLDLLRQAFLRGALSFHGSLKHLNAPDAFSALLDEARVHEWVVYAKPPFGGPTQVLKYLARYTHRVAISNSRIVSLEDGEVAFRWRDYVHGNRHRTMTLHATEFIRRFLLHVLPKGFPHIRHYGFLSNRSRKTDIALCRILLGQDQPSDPSIASTAATPDVLPARDPKRCPACKQGHMRIVETIPPAAALACVASPAGEKDTS